MMARRRAARVPSGASDETCEGNVEVPHVPQALTHFFRTDNLIALRELALRFLADETEEDLLEHLRGRQSEGLWDTAERIMEPPPNSCSRLRWLEPTCT